jgi:phage FluMu gp28-like protein
LIFPRLRRAFEQRELMIPISRAIREDLHAMMQTYNGSEYNYWSPRTKEGHSDICTADALALRAAGEGGSSLFVPRTGGRRSRNVVRTVF